MKKYILGILLLISFMLQGCSSKINYENIDKQLSVEKDKCYSFMDSLDQMGMSDDEFHWHCDGLLSLKDQIINDYSKNPEKVTTRVSDLLEEFNHLDIKVSETKYTINNICLKILNQVQSIDPNFQYMSNIDDEKSNFTKKLMKSMVDTEDIVIKLSNIDSYDGNSYLVNFYVNLSSKGTFYVGDNNKVNKLVLKTDDESTRETKVDMIYTSAIAIISEYGFNNDNVDIEKFFDQVLDQMESPTPKTLVYDNLVIKISATELEISSKDMHPVQV